MSETNFMYLVYGWIAIAILIFPFVLSFKAPYGRHTTKKWGPLIDNRIGWIIMELPALVIFAAFFLSGDGAKPFPVWIFFSLWVIHYINRTLVFPFRLKTKGKKMPVAIVLMAIFFNLINGFVNGYFFGTLATGQRYPVDWLTDWRFLSGITIFLAGMAINWQSDHLLINLRKPGEKGYIIPKKGLFRYISCPNHFGEMVEWGGFALMAWCLPALSFAIWTIANLLPRALQHHRWYKQTFADYPKERKAVFPFIL